jgi:uncharacterized protein YqeY
MENLMPSTILDKIITDVRDAMKAGEKDRVTALRTLHAQIKDATVNAGKEPTDADVATLIAKALKQRLDSIDQFKAANRQDLVDKEVAELNWYKVYQPEQLNEGQIEELVKAAIAETGAASKKEMGKVMAALMPKTKGKADGKLVNQIVQRLLN